MQGHRRAFSSDGRSPRERDPSSHVGSWLRRLTIVATFAAILAVAMLLGRISFQRIQFNADRTNVLLISSRSEKLDTNLVNLAAVNPRFTYARGNSEFAKTLQQELKVQETADSAKLAVVLDEAGKEAVFSRDPALVQSKVDAAFDEVEVSKTPWFLWLGVIGVIGGTMIGRRVVGLLPALLAGLGLISAYKWLWACPTCPTTLALGMDAALLGTLIYSASAAVLALAPNWLPDRRIFGLVCGFVSAWQVMSYFSAPAECIPCGTILLGNLLIATAMLRDWATIGNVSGARPSRVPIVLIAYAVLFACLVGARPSDLGPEKQKTGPLASLWKGRSIKDLGLKPDMDHGQLLVIGVSTCAPCVDAHTYLTRNVELPVRFVELDRQGSSGYSKEKIPFRPDEIPSTPALFTVAPGGRIIQEYYGWSTDPLWTDSFIHSVSLDLDLNKEKSK